MNDVTTQAIDVPGYRLIRALGSSGVATVYVAMQRALDRQVAVKVFDALDETAVARFEQLLRTNARLAHPNIAGIHQIGRAANGRLFHSAPLLASAGAPRPNLRLQPLKVAAVLRELLGALAYAHRRGVVHGGIQPANVLFGPDGHVRLADFGIARCASELGLAHAGAAGYLSPEQVRGNPPGQRSDLYSLGVLAWELLTGSQPFHGGNAISTAVAHVEQPVPQLPPAARAWQAFFDRALAKSPEQRFQSAQEMAGALSAIDAQPDAARATDGPRARNPKWMLATMALVVVAAVAVAGWATRGRPPASGTAAATAPASTAAADAAAPPQAAAPAPASSLATLASRIQTLLTQADALRAGGHLFSPPGDNTAGRYLAVLALDPGNPAAAAGIDNLLTTLRGQLDEAWRERRIGQAVGLLKQGDLLAARVGPSEYAWQADRAELARKVGAAVVAAAEASDARGLATLKPLAEALPATYPAGFDLAVAERRAAMPAAGSLVRDRGGPVLIYVPASGDAPAFAIERVEVTRAGYAAFANATHRPASRCLEAYNPFSRFRGLTWRKPGFAQGGNHPVVCVSWNDAAAYAAWLSRVTGETYRLPTGHEWLRAARGVPQGSPCQLGNVDDASRHSAMDNDRWSCDDGAAHTAPVGHYAPSGIGAYDMYGNVSEWLEGGDPGARVFRGLSWRDGSRQTPLGRRGTADTDVGYTNVGFRVVRVIGAAQAAPRVVSDR